MEAHHVTQQAKGLKGRPGVRMNLGGRHVERPKNAHRERVKRQRHVEVRKKASIHIKERGTVAPCTLSRLAHKAQRRNN